MLVELLLIGVLQAPLTSQEHSLLNAISKVESNNNCLAVNRQTWDYGLLQINHLTATRYGKFPFQMLDRQQNVQLALRLLRDYRRRFGHESQWECRYNQGTGAGVPKRNGCKIYFAKLVRAGYIKPRGAK